MFSDTNVGLGWHCSHMEWGPNRDQMGTHILVKWGPLAVEMGANWGPKKRIFDNLTETSKFIEDGASKDAQSPSFTLLLLGDQNPQMGTNGGAVGWYC